MKRKLLTGTVLLIAAFSISETKATSCTRLPSCEQLGYTMTKADCGEVPVLRCPFALSDDNQVFCRKEAESAVSLGAIVYGDGTVSTTIISGKTPVGIVFDAANRLAVALTDVKQDGSAGSEAMNWSNNDYDIPNLTNCKMDTGNDLTVISCGVDGRSNTDKILACGDSCGGTPAATACNLYEPVGCTTDFCKKGNWFLPSMRNLNDINKQKVAINATLFFLGIELLTEREFYYWSSTEFQNDVAWVFVMNFGLRSYSGKSYGDHILVRPVVSF